jgi:hypothetical protein
MGINANFYVMTEQDVGEVCRDWVVPLAEPIVKMGIDPFTGVEKEYRWWFPPDSALSSANPPSYAKALRELGRRAVQHFDLKISLLSELDPVFNSRPVAYALDERDPFPLYRIPFPIAQSLLAMRSAAPLPEHCALFMFPEPML